MNTQHEEFLDVTIIEMEDLEEEQDMGQYC